MCGGFLAKPLNTLKIQEKTQNREIFGFTLSRDFIEIYFAIFRLIIIFIFIIDCENV